MTLVDCEKVRSCSHRGSVLVEVLMPARQSYSSFFLILCSICHFPLCEANEKETDGNGKKVAGSMDYGDAVVYGLVEGITEFLPISSTGHLILTKEWLTEGENLSEWTLQDGSKFQGRFIRMDPNRESVLVSIEGGEGERKFDLNELSMKSRNFARSSFHGNRALDAYLIVIQAGAILAVTLVYRKQVWAILLGFLGLDPRGRRLGKHLLFAFLPAALAGPFLDDWIEGYLLFPVPIALALFVGALLMHWVERKRKRENSFAMPDSGKTLDDLTIRSALWIGCLQCFAMWPGTSRSMMTIVGGYLVGLTRAKAAEFSFLLGLVTLTAAAGYKGLTHWEVMQAHLEIGPVLLGCLVAGGSAAAAVIWLVGYLNRHGLGIFVWYRIILSILVLAFHLGF